ncbi:hypothetical protein ACSNOI_00675 [Actinomadura kijaniata]|uniref:hypothetical protein n=1 Tax=Actinomadura kijaniata TaxID=46161 RepID=UPI003F19D99C
MATLLRVLAAPLVLAAAVMSVIGLVSDNPGLVTASWVPWAVGIAGFALRWVNRRRTYGSVEELMAAAEAGVPRAMRAVAMKHKIEGNLQEAERLLRAAVEAGDVESMWEMGRLVEQRDGLAASEPWFRMAAEHGHLVAKRFFRPGSALNQDGKNPL